MIECISDLRLFLTISRTLNFREAGERLGYSPAVVTTRIKRLEAVTGKSLFVRSTRHIQLTEEGRQLLRIAEQIVDLSEQMGPAPHSSKVESDYTGTVRISAPHSFARLFLIKPLHHLMVTHPELTIDLILDDGVTKMIEDEIDISFRIGGEISHNADHFDLFRDKRILIAAPRYLEQQPPINTPQDLKNHQCLTYSHMKDWHLNKDKRSYRIPLTAAIFCNTGDFLRRLALDGAGITIKSLWSIQEELVRGELVQVLPDYTAGPEQLVRALLLKRDYRPPRIIHTLNTIKKYITNITNHNLLIS